MLLQVAGVHRAGAHAEQAVERAETDGGSNCHDSGHNPQDDGQHTMGGDGAATSDNRDDGADNTINGGFVLLRTSHLSP